MNYDEAIRILKALVEGNDPISQEPLPADSVLQNPTVMRALLLAQGVIQSGVDRQKRRGALPKRVGATWTQQEDQKLIAEWKDKKALEEIAAGHGRTVRAIESRLERLGLITADQRTTSVAWGERSPSAAGGGSSEEGSHRRPGRPKSGGGSGDSTITAAD